MEDILAVPKNAQLTKILTRTFIFILACTILAGIYYDWKFIPKIMLENVEKNSDAGKANKTASEIAEVTAGSTQKNEPSNLQKNLSDQKIPECLSEFGLHEMPRKLRDLQKVLEKKIGKPEKEKMLWRNVHYLESNGEKRRLRVELRASGSGDLRYEMRLFSVDAEDLPVPIKLADTDRFSPSGEVLLKYLDGKNIEYNSMLTEFQYANGATLEAETENGVATLFHYRGKDFSLGCSLESISSALDCSCLR